MGKRERGLGERRIGLYNITVMYKYESQFYVEKESLTDFATKICLTIFNTNSQNTIQL